MTETDDLMTNDLVYLRQMADTIDAVFWLADANEQRILYVSPAYDRIWGRNRQRLYTHKHEFFDSIHPDDQERVQSASGRCVAQERFDVEYRVVRPDGEVRWIRDRGFLIRDQAGAPDRLAGFAEDITEYKKTELALQESEAWYRTLFDAIDEGGVNFDISKRKRPEQILRESEEKYRTLFDAIDEGFCVIEMLFDENETPIDYRFLEINSTFAAQTGLKDVLGKRVRELKPDLEQHWFEMYGNIALTGEPIRFENCAQTMEQRWFDVYAYRYGQPQNRQVAVLFKDISDRKRREANLAFLTEVQDDFARLTSPDEIMQTVGAKIGSYLNLSICAFADVDEARDEAVINYNWHREDAPNLIGVYRISKFVTEEFQAAARAGKIVVVSDTNTDARTDASSCAALKINSFISVPFLRDGQWKFLLNAYDSHPRDWREDEVELFRELSNRIFPRLDRARAEAIVAADLKDMQLLLELGARLVTEGDIQALYQEILSAAIALLRADAGTVQILDEATQELVRLASQGFERNMTEHFHRVNASSNTPCGVALKNGNRTFVNFDVPESEDPDGSLRMHVEAGYLFAQSTPLMTRAGKPIGMVSTHWCKHCQPTDRELRFLDLLARQAADLISQRQTQAALQENEDRFRMAIESAQLGTWDWNLSTQRLIWDERCKAMFGLPKEAESSIEVFFAGLHPDERERLEQVIQWALNPASGGKFDVEYRTIGIQDGVERWIAAKGQVYFDSGNNPQRFIGTVLNITEQKRIAAEREQLLAREQAARETAEKANRIKDEFLAVLSHELRSPLNPILGWSKLLQRGNLDEARTQQALKTIERNAQLQSELIEDLLDVSRILQGKLKLNVNPINLPTIIRGAIETVKLAAEAKSIQVEVNLDPEVGQVSGDATRLQQVVWNLLSNAVKFTPAGGRVEVHLESVENQAQITVRDNGKGIAPEFLPHVFDYFRQEDGATTRRFGGLGLGLAIVRQIVELHGGTIRAKSLGVGLGATFTARLPLMPIQSSIHPEPDLSSLSDNLNGIQVLIVDDEADSRDFIAFVVEQAGASVSTAASATEAIATLTQSHLDVLLSDIGMPDMDGYMLMQQIRLLPPEQGGHMKAIALTAYAGDFNQQQALQAGFQQHLSKPVEPGVLVKAIINLLKDNKASQL